MRKRASIAFIAYAIASGAAWAGTTAGGVPNHAGVNKDCVASVFGYVADGAAPLKGQERFDYLKKRLVTSPESAVKPFVNFVAIGKSQSASDEPADLPQCTGAAYLR